MNTNAFYHGVHNHDHNHCSHPTIKHCAHCDIAYCTNCSKEWKNTWWNTSSGAAITYYSTPSDLSQGINAVNQTPPPTGHNHGV